MLRWHAQMMPNADEMVRELHVRTVQFVHKQLSAAKPVSEEAKGGTLEEQISRIQSQLALGMVTEDDTEAEVLQELADQEEVHVDVCAAQYRMGMAVQTSFDDIINLLKVLFLLRAVRFQFLRVRSSNLE